MTQIQKGIHYLIPTVNLSCENTRKSESIFSTSVTALVSFFPHVSSWERPGINSLVKILLILTLGNPAHVQQDHSQLFVCLSVFMRFGKEFKVLYRYPVKSSQCSFPGKLTVPLEMPLKLLHQRVENHVFFWVIWQYPTHMLNFICHVALFFQAPVGG